MMTTRRLMTIMQYEMIFQRCDKLCADALAVVFGQNVDVQVGNVAGIDVLVGNFL